MNSSDLSAVPNGSKLAAMIGAVIYVRVSTKADRELESANAAEGVR
jgi:hypothetical protein